MPPAAADRNLLFGILALQMDFIDRDSLVAAMNAWVLDKARPLGQVLSAQGRLTPERLQLLDALVAEHLRAHGDDPQRSLAAARSVGSVGQELHRLGDADLQSSLAHVSSARTDTDPDATRPYVPDGAAAQGVRYRILRPHARGGLGEVSVAYDTELDREVALKEIREPHAGDSTSRSRFLLEARLTGGLEHPGIVPVYGLGHYADGRPFYAMRFIKGENLKDAIEQFHRAAPGLPAGERALRLRQLLRRFLDVCNAIAYAHSRGVLHRDLKPGNILVGKYGETLVVDWGLAKVLGRTEPETSEGPLPGTPGGDSALTDAGAVLGTPAYMCPEQAAGRLDQLGPRSDVYSLGATLYCLLTGRPPFTDSDRAEVLRKVGRGDFPRPRELARDLAPALEAVCLKALALKAEARYASPAEVAADLERWLADEPVRCYREPPAVRLARWGRKHRPVVAVAGALLLAAVVGLSVSTVLVRQEQRQTEQARQAEARQKELAQENARKARQAVDDYLTAVSENKLLSSPLPGLQPLRKELLSGALKYYQEFVEKHQEDPSLRADLAQTYYRLGKINREMGANAEALQAFGQALSLWQELAAESPADPGYRFGMAQLLSAMGDTQVRQPDQKEKGVAALKEARALYEALVQEQPTNPDFRGGMAKLYGWLSNALSEDPRPITPEELELDQQALAIYEDLARTDPKYTTDVASAAMTLGFGYTRLRKPVPALHYHRRSLALLEEVSRQRPPEFWVRREVIRAYLNIGFLNLNVTGDYPEALKNLDQMRRLVDQLAQENPSVSELQGKRVECRTHSAKALLYSGQAEKAREMATQAVEIAKSYAGGDDPLGKWYEQVEAYRDLGLALSQLGRDTDALDAYQAACDAAMQYGRLASLHNDFLVKGTISSFLYQLRRVGPPERVLDVCQRIAPLYDAAARRDAGPEALRDCVRAHRELGDAYREAGHDDEAAAAYQHVIGLWEKELHRDTTRASPVGDVLETAFALAGLRLTAGRPAEARELLVLVKEILADGKEPRADDFDRARLSMLSGSLTGAGKAELTAEETAERRRYTDAAIDALRRPGKRMYQTADTIRNDPILRPLHARDDFRQLLAALEEKERYDQGWQKRIKQAREWAGQGQHARAAAEAAAVGASPLASWRQWPVAADLYRDCARAAVQDHLLRPDVRDELARQYADAGIRLLRRQRDWVLTDNEEFSGPTVAFEAGTGRKFRLLSYSRNLELARADARLAGLCGIAGAQATEKEKADRRRYTDEAVAALRRFMDEPPRYDTLAGEDWDALRARPDFREMEAELKARSEEVTQTYQHFRKAEELAWEDRHAEASAEVAALVESRHADSHTFLQAAQIYSLCSAAARREEKLAPAAKEELATRYADRAMELLHRAVEKGLSPTDGNLEREPDFNPLRNREDFRKLFTEVKKKVPQ